MGFRRSGWTLSHPAWFRRYRSRNDSILISSSLSSGSGMAIAPDRRPGLGLSGAGTNDQARWLANRRGALPLLGRSLPASAFLPAYAYRGLAPCSTIYSATESRYVVTGKVPPPWAWAESTSTVTSFTTPPQRRGRRFRRALGSRRKPPDASVHFSIGAKHVWEWMERGALDSVFNSPVRVITASCPPMRATYRRFWTSLPP